MHHVPHNAFIAASLIWPPPGRGTSTGSCGYFTGLCPYLSEHLSLQYAINISAQGVFSCPQPYPANSYILQHRFWRLCFDAKGSLCPPDQSALLG